MPRIQRFLGLRLLVRPLSALNLTRGTDQVLPGGIMPCGRSATRLSIAVDAAPGLISVKVERGAGRGRSQKAGGRAQLRVGAPEFSASLALGRLRRTCRGKRMRLERPHSDDNADDSPLNLQERTAEPVARQSSRGGAVESSVRIQRGLELYVS